MILDTTTKSLTIVLGEAKTTNDCDITASWADQTPDQFLPGNNTLVSNGTGAVTVVPAPAVAGIERQVQEVTLYNNDTVSHTVFLREHDGANTRVITSATLAANASFRWPQASVPTGGTVTEVDTDFGITGGPVTTSGTVRSVGSLLNTQSGDYTVQNSDLGKYIVMTKATAATLTLTPANLRTGWWAIVTQALSGSAAVDKVLTYMPTTGTFDGQASGLDFPRAQRLIEFDGINFNTVLLRGGFLEVAASDTGFTTAKPTRLGTHEFQVWGAGGAGGSGRRGAAGSVRQGGTAGGGGASAYRRIPDSYITTTLVFTVPTGAAGGTAISADNTNGNPGSASPGNTVIAFSGGNYVLASPGGPGAGGQGATALSGGGGGGTVVGGSGGTTQAVGGGPSIGTTDTTAAGQIGGSNGNLAQNGQNSGWGGASGGGATNTAAATGLAGGSGIFGSPGGGAGGGIDAANTARAGGNGASGAGVTNASTGGAAGTSGVAGGNATSATAGPTANGHGSSGGGGGAGFDNTAGGTASAGGAGADGGIGSGGGGGGASLNGSNSGAGGKGGDGLARWWYG